MLQQEKQEKFESAKLILDKIGLKTKPNKRLIAKKCKLLAKIYNVKLYAGDAEGMVFNFFKNNPHVDIFSKSVRIGEQKHTDKVVFFSDVYDFDEHAMTKFVGICCAGGLSARYFDAEYEAKDYSNGEPAPKGVLSSGYDQMYRGRLVGVIL